MPQKKSHYWGQVDKYAMLFQKMSDTFISEYCKSRYAVIDNKAHAELAWASFCQFAQQWIIERQEELDMGFAKLCAVPLRRNWLTKIKVNKNQNRLELTALDPNLRVIRWDIVAQASDKFHAATLRMELAEKMRLGNNYLRRVYDLVNGYAPRIHDIFIPYLEEARFPNARLSHCDRERLAGHRKGNDAIAPISLEAKNDQNSSPDLAGVLEARPEVNVASENAVVHEVPDLQQSEQNVWDAWRAMEESKVRRNGAVGVPLRSHAEKQASGELLDGAKVKRRTSRLALANRTEQLPEPDFAI